MRFLFALMVLLPSAVHAGELSSTPPGPPPTVVDTTQSYPTLAQVEREVYRGAFPREDFWGADAYKYTVRLRD